LRAENAGKTVGKEHISIVKSYILIAEIIGGDSGEEGKVAAEVETDDAGAKNEGRCRCPHLIEDQHDNALENIDIGGPTMVRAAAKNHSYVAVVVNPHRYGALIGELEERGTVSSETRFNLAAEAFNHTAAYDAAIASYFKALPEANVEEYPGRLSLSYSKLQDLRYGENPQQSAAFYAVTKPLQGLAAAKQLQGKELSFNNLNDLHAAWELVLEFEQPVAVAVKHANPCGVGSAASLLESYRLAYEGES